MPRITPLIYKFWPVFVILIAVLAIALTNVHLGTYLTGGDNLHTELNLKANLERTIFATWQEYQGLGLLGGMGHASDLLRQLAFAGGKIFIPENMLRYVFAFLSLFLGSVGAFILSRHALSRFWNKDYKHLNLMALTGGLFYLFNLSTLQAFFVPFEPFLYHFASLPWILVATFKYFEKQNKKNTLILATILVLSTPSFYVPTIFIVFLLASGIISLTFFSKTKSYIRTVSKYYLLVFLINAFWLLPFLFFALTSTGVNISAKINQMATEAIFLQNREFGGIKDVLLLKGFWFNYVEPNKDGVFVYMFSSWRQHLSNPLVLGIGYLLFTVAFVGAIGVIKKKTRMEIAIVALFIFSIIMLTTATPPFSIINELLRNHFPLFNQAFRFPFTKFSILASLSFSVLFSFGLLFISEKVRFIRGRYVFVPLISILCLVFFVLPVFKGDLFYEKETIKIPNEYFQTFEYFKAQDPNTRIANLPQYTFWGWSFYKWNYSGSGFLWYGIEQPILDRTFDVWSKTNENYYWELNQAIYSKNPKLLESVFNKYDISWVMIDKNVITPSSPKSLFYEELESMLKEISVKKVKQFGKIEIYSFNLKNKPDKFISAINSYKNINGYEWSDFDQAYFENGDYISSDNEAYSEYFPFRSLFTGKELNPKFKITETDKFIDFESNLDVGKNLNLSIPSLLTRNNTLPIELLAQRSGGIINIKFRLKSPEILIEENGISKSIWKNEIEREVLTFRSSTSQMKANINGVTSFEIVNLKDNETRVVGLSSFSIKEPNSIVISDSSKEIASENIEGAIISEWFVQDSSIVTVPNLKPHSTIIVRVTKQNDKYSNYDIDPVAQIEKGQSSIVNCDSFRKDYFAYFIREEEQKKLIELSSKNASPCISFYLQNLDHDSAYLVDIQSKNLTGRKLHFWVLNEDEKIAVVDTYLNSNDEQSRIVLPPMEKFGKAYSVHFDNISIGNVKSGNLLGKVSIQPLPYYFITNLKSVNATELVVGKSNIESIKHPNKSLYLAQIHSNDQTLLSLSQSFSPFWRAYVIKNDSIFNQVFPFLGKEVKEKYLVNNWKNGWLLKSSNKSQTLAIVYIPQYLQYVGFILSASILILLFAKSRKQ